MKRVAVIKTTFLALALVANIAHAREVRFRLLECSTHTTTAYTFDITSSELKEVDIATGSEMGQTNVYTIKEDRLVAGGQDLAKAKEILFQCRMDDVDLVFIRRIHITLATPLRVISAFAGHPMEINEIAVLKIMNGKITADKEVTRKLSSWTWHVTIMK